MIINLVVLDILKAYSKRLKLERKIIYENKVRVDVTNLLRLNVLKNWDENF